MAKEEGAAIAELVAREKAIRDAIWQGWPSILRDMTPQVIGQCPRCGGSLTNGHQCSSLFTHEEVEDQEPVHSWFGLSYSHYLVLPRSVLQSLPLAVQQQFIAAIHAVERAIAPGSFPRRGTTYDVRLRNDATGRWAHDPLCDYERGRRVVTVAELCDERPPLFDGTRKE